MEATSYSALCFFRKVFHLYCIIILTLSLVSASVPNSSRWSDSDRLSLLAIKSQIEADPVGALSSWNDSIHHCYWKGITCSRRHPGRVTILDLQSQKLQGTLSPFIGNLTFLSKIIIELNNLHGAIPQEIGSLHRLQDLVLSNNSFVGEIPANLTHCTDLINLYLDNNQFSGNILSVVSSFHKIVNLSLDENYFSGYIPSSFGNLSSLTIFTINENHIEGSIPGDLCRIPRLRVFNVLSNNLTGKIPACLYNQSNISVFFVAENQLEGSLPSDIGFTLPKLRAINFADNKFTGPIPTSLPNATNLRVMEFSLNSFTGSVPTDLGRLQGLESLLLDRNQLGNRYGDNLRFINSLTNCTSLYSLGLGRNLLRGRLPTSISNLSTTLRILDVRENMLYGEIPSGIGNLVNLEFLVLETNILTGPIPPSLGNLTKLANLYLGVNELHGSIPPALGNCINILALDLSNNNLVVTIPLQLFSLNLPIFFLDINHNALTGSLPLQIGNLTKLTEFYVSNNKLSGYLPESLGDCLSLEKLFLDNNFFQGEIPSSFNMLKGLNGFDLSQNELSGNIPAYLGQLPLQYLNLSFNRLEGNVPNTGVFGNTSAFSVQGNTNLCGGLRELKLPSCMQNARKSSPSIKVIVAVIVGSLCFLAFLCMLLMCYKRKTLKRQSSSRTMLSLWYKRVSYGELFKATNGFSDENLIGVGSHGSVYKAILQQINKTVAVKVIKLQIEGASKSFLKECNALRNLRHRNLLKIISSCSSVDFKGNDFKALVFDFMPNGSLDGWLHPRVEQQQIGSRFLNFTLRLNIAIDVAYALEYLHHHCQPYVVHCDVKPSNVLLDDDMTAHVADFGIAKMFSTSSHDSVQSLASSVVIKGSIGYVAPEYGAGGEISMRGDVYSYGILLLEMFTRKKPTDDMFVNGFCLHDYGEMALPDKVIDIIDPMILLEENDVEQSQTRGSLHENLVSIIRMAVTCSDGSPLRRMTMSEVVVELQRVKKRYQGF